MRVRLAVRPAEGAIAEAMVLALLRDCQAPVQQIPPLVQEQGSWGIFLRLTFMNGCVVSSHDAPGCVLW
jgi:hypothetical protein